MSGVGCVFCDKAEAEFRSPDDIMVFEPLNPVTPGHLLVVPVRHINDFTDLYGDEDSEAYTKAMLIASYVAQKMWQRDAVDCNLITSAGAFATQTVKHLHIHLVPRRENDGLKLPWTGQDAISTL